MRRILASFPSCPRKTTRHTKKNAKRSIKRTSGQWSGYKKKKPCPVVSHRKMLPQKQSIPSLAASLQCGPALVDITSQKHMELARHQALWRMQPLKLCTTVPHEGRVSCANLTSNPIGFPPPGPLPPFLQATPSITPSNGFRVLFCRRGCWGRGGSQVGSLRRQLAGTL